ncbi:hypothetical protein SeMB42_g00103 [Synchytrium endobioticum]|nr:hypothetical protein SeMB42_g00103 [Synchytrium endobioticum]
MKTNHTRKHEKDAYGYGVIRPWLEDHLEASVTGWFRERVKPPKLDLGNSSRRQSSKSADPKNIPASANGSITKLTALGARDASIDRPLTASTTFAANLAATGAGTEKPATNIRTASPTKSILRNASGTPSPSRAHFAGVPVGNNPLEYIQEEPERRRSRSLSAGWKMPKFMRDRAASSGASSYGGRSDATSEYSESDATSTYAPESPVNPRAEVVVVSGTESSPPASPKRRPLERQVSQSSTKITEDVNKKEPSLFERTGSLFRRSNSKIRRNEKASESSSKETPNQHIIRQNSQSSYKRSPSKDSSHHHQTGAQKREHETSYRSTSRQRSYRDGQAKEKKSLRSVRDSDHDGDDSSSEYFLSETEERPTRSYEPSIRPVKSRTRSNTNYNAEPQNAPRSNPNSKLVVSLPAPTQSAPIPKSPKRPHGPSRAPPSDVRKLAALASPAPPPLSDSSLIDTFEAKTVPMVKQTNTQQLSRHDTKTSTNHNIQKASIISPASPVLSSPLKVMAVSKEMIKAVELKPVKPQQQRHDDEQSFDVSLPSLSGDEDNGSEKTIKAKALRPSTSRGRIGRGELDASEITRLQLKPPAEPTTTKIQVFPPSNPNLTEIKISNPGKMSSKDSFDDLLDELGDTSEGSPLVHKAGLDLTELSEDISYEDV